MYAEGGDWRGNLRVVGAFNVVSGGEDEEGLGNGGVMENGEVLDFLALDARLIRCWLRLGVTFAARELFYLSVSFDV